MTEQAELEDDEFKKIKELYERLNIKIALDDYGTGYSNVQNLLRYMPNYVKIDRSLLTEIQNSPKKRHFVREIIEFCHDNNILALAEGVETSEELHTVILLGADLIQGYYTARPSAAIINSIPDDIKHEIKHYRQKREEGKEQHIYVMDKSEHVTLEKLIKEEYNCILVGKNNSCDDVTITSAPGVEAKININIANDFKGNIILENVTLVNEKTESCIDIGENCDVRLVLTGNNYLKKGGIKVPESSKLVVSGEGRLSIFVEGESCYGIGNDTDSAHGELIFEQGVSVENHSSDIGVCIGAGFGGRIRILHGQFALNMIGKIGVGIGTIYADTDLDLFACDITVDISMIYGIAVGSINGNCISYIHGAAANFYLSGENIIGIGTFSGKRCNAEISDANVVFNILSDKGSAVAAMEGNTSFKLCRAGMRITEEGDNSIPFGSYITTNAKIELINSDSSVKLVTKEEHLDYIRRTNVKISGGRARFIVNGEEIEYTTV